MHKIKVAIICPYFFRGDAVGAAARDTYLALNSYESFDVSCIWKINDYDDIKGQHVDGLAQLLDSEYFQAANVIIYIYAIYDDMHDALMLGNGHAKQILRFHNVTPKELMPPHTWTIIDKSFDQFRVFENADAIWADSEENFQELGRNGVPVAKAEVVPLCVRPIVNWTQSFKRNSRVELLYVGRIFHSKGVLDIVEACDALRRRTTIPFRLRIAGNLRFSDSDYVEATRQMIAAKKLAPWVEFVGTVTSEELSTLYREANIYVTGSKHEGFCVPVIEGLAAGCIPVSYPLSNLRFIADGWGKLTKDATIESLAKALLETVEALGAGSSPNREIRLDRGLMTIEDFDRGAQKYVKAFSPGRFSEGIARRVRQLVLT